jgi:hypothetical protein
MKKTILLVILACCMAGCTKHDEIPFKGVVISAYQCSMLSTSNIPIVGYFVQLDEPKDVGSDYTTNSGVHHNTVILYDPGCRLYKGNRISGSFYFDEDYSRANCDYHLTDVKLPEGVFVDVTVE